MEYTLAEEVLLCPPGVWRMGCGSSSREQLRQEAEERGEVRLEGVLAGLSIVKRITVMFSWCLLQDF